MTRSVLVGLAGLFAAAAVQPSLAADLPARMPVKAPVTMAAPSWYGSFVGVNGGGAWSNDGVHLNNGGGALAGLTPASLDTKATGGMVGVTWGSNWQTDRFVYGFISDIDYSDIRKSSNFAVAGITGSAEERLRWFGTTRVRAGYLVTDDLLLYGSGGLASGNTTVTSNAMIGGASVAADSSRYRYGWAAGAGMEYRMGPWSVLLDYVHYDLGNRDVTLTSPVAADFVSTSTRFSGDVIRGGINYRFNWQVWDLVTGRSSL